jgi:hypothetical protein
LTAVNLGLAGACHKTVMSQKPPPGPALAAHNWRKRAEQMRVIAEAVENLDAKEALFRRAAEFLAKAEEAEREQGTR